MSKNIKNSPLRIYGALIGAGVQAISSYDWGGKRKDAAAKAEGEYNDMKEKYMGLDTSNLYSDVSNPYANMQNTMEDLTVNQQQAQFQGQQNQQSSANIMGQMRGAAGSSGVAGLAQAMSNQGAQQAQQASASIGQQESANQKAAASQAGKLQTMDRQGGWKADMTRRSGADSARQLEHDRTTALTTMAANKSASASGAEQAGKDAMWSGIGNVASSAIGAFGQENEGGPS